jgi:SPP1 gp7 family putative phage head morphogenesis protein
MTWQRAMEADARLAARSAVKVRAALKQSINSKTMFEAYLATQPQSTGNIAQDRARARAWAIINVRINMETMKMVLLRIWATGYLLGNLAARELIAEAERRESKSADIQKADFDLDIDVDWSSWTPGDELTALILKPTRAFRRLLESQGITLKELTNTGLRDIGNAIGEAIALGLSPKQAAKLINNTVASPMRALMIAITESNRAVSAATVARYEQQGLQEMEWTTFDPCDICAGNDGVTVPIGGTFPSGHTQPPAHPHCRCALLPVIPDFDAPNYTGGSVIQMSSMPSSNREPVTVRHINPYASQIEWVD